eukprot:CAMPEP_0172302834 /NCGR_PEP_ID=MMETSP1058-20130122/4485_1 /TAXON_ID=83371 /ORGANISM="Detonula confervacea, Strain CCMP 353" /LENGTH=426 /DNA_ID=CAMNT_0013013467 /DNA_START=38 /DNA_END=1318 /DNA_ORIENTATION=+
MKLSLCLLAAAITTRQHYVEAFSLRMQSVKLPSPLRSVASPPPPSTSSSLRFTPPSKSVLSVRLATASATTESAPSTETPSKTKTLGLLTFDLDDSLYPIDPVLQDANEIFVQTMSNYGYNLEPNDIVEAGKRIREEAGPIAGKAMSHTEVRLEAIRREMERKMIEKKLQECAEDWATEVESLTAPIRNSAEKWAKSAVSQTVVESIYSAWERERHHSAERHLYPDIITSLQKIKEEHPDVVIGAVTDGKANPMLMVFSLAPYFDFCMSWEDDAAGRIEFFKELGNSTNADLHWIYRAAYDKYTEIAETKKGLRKSFGEDEAEETRDGVESDRPLWIHVGDDLAYDVGGSASCGAKTILLDLDEEYGQTAKVRFSPNAQMPSWNTASDEEIVNRKAMNDAAEGMVDKRVTRLTMLPDAIDEILKGE